MEIDLTLRKSFLEYLIRRDILTDETALDVLDRQQEQTPPIGKLALKLRVLNMKQVFNTLSTQVDSHLRFGEQAIALGYMDVRDLEYLLQEQNKARPRLCQILQDMEIIDQATVESLREEFVAETIISI